METPETATSSTAPIRPKVLVEALGISAAYASMLLNGQRVPPQPLALRIWRAAGVKLGPLATLSDDDCAQLERLTGAVREVAAVDGPTITAKPIAMTGEGFAG